MAKKPAAPAAEDIPAMDYAEHDSTWRMFTELVKWVIIASAVACIALYCYIEADQPILGTLLILALPVGAVALLVMRSRSAD